MLNRPSKITFFIVLILLFLFPFSFKFCQAESLPTFSWSDAQIGTARGSMEGLTLDQPATSTANPSIGPYSTATYSQLNAHYQKVTDQINNYRIDAWVNVTKFASIDGANQYLSQKRAEWSLTTLKTNVQSQSWWIFQDKSAGGQLYNFGYVHRVLYLPHDDPARDIPPEQTSYWLTSGDMITSGTETNQWVVTIYIDGSGFDYDNTVGIETNQMDTLLQTFVNQAIYLITHGSSTATTPTNTPTPTPDESIKEQFTVQVMKGEVQIKQAGSDSWIPAVPGMTISQGDRIWVRGDLTPGSSVLLHYKGQPGSNGSYYGVANAEQTLYLDNTADLTMVSYSVSHAAPTNFELAKGRLFVEVLMQTSTQAPTIKVTTPQAQITNTHTQFEIEVTDTATNVHTYEGSVDVSGINGLVTQTVSANEATQVLTGYDPQTPYSFDPQTTDHWWTSIAQTTDTSPQWYTLILTISVVAVIVVVLLIVIVVVSRQKGKAHAVPNSQHPFLPPPPPPPP
jgi:hypothetical protein